MDAPDLAHAAPSEPFYNLKVAQFGARAQRKKGTATTPVEPGTVEIRAQVTVALEVAP